MKPKSNRTVQFSTPNGNISGVVIKLYSDHALVGVQSTTKPTVWNGKANVPNNSLWVVPYANIIQEHTPQHGPKAYTGVQCGA